MVPIRSIRTGSQGGDGLKQIGLVVAALVGWNRRGAGRAARDAACSEEQVAGERLPKVEERIPRDMSVAELPTVGQSRRRAADADGRAQRTPG